MTTYGAPFHSFCTISSQKKKENGFFEHENSFCTFKNALLFLVYSESLQMHHGYDCFISRFIYWAEGHQTGLTVIHIYTCPLRQIEIIEWNKTLNGKSRIIALLHTAHSAHTHTHTHSLAYYENSDLFIYFICYYFSALGSWDRSSLRTRKKKKQRDVVYIIQIEFGINWISRRQHSSVRCEWIIAYIQSSVCDFVLSFQLFSIHLTLSRYYLLSLVYWVFLFSLSFLFHDEHKADSQMESICLMWIWNVRRRERERERRAIRMNIKSFNGFIVRSDILLHCLCDVKTDRWTVRVPVIILTHRYDCVCCHNWASMTDKKWLILFKCTWQMYWSRLQSLALLFQMNWFVLLIYCIQFPMKYYLHIIAQERVRERWTHSLINKQ